MDIPDNADWLFALSDLRRTWLTTGDKTLHQVLTGDGSLPGAARIQEACYKALVAFSPDTPTTHFYRRLTGADLFMATENPDITKLQADIANLRIEHGQAVEGCIRLERDLNLHRATASRLDAEIRSWNGSASDPEVHQKVLNMNAANTAAGILDENLGQQKDLLNQIEQVLTSQETSLGVLLTVEQNNALLTKTAELVESVQGARAKLTGSSSLRQETKLLADAKGRNEVATERLLGGSWSDEAELDSLMLEEQARQLMGQDK